MSTEKKTLTTDHVRWVSIGRQSKEELDALASEFQFHDIDLRDCLPPNQRPKLVERSGYLFMILLFPFYDRAKREVYTTEVDFFILPNTIVTIHEGILPSLDRVFARYESAYNQPGNTPALNTAGLLYDILDELLDDIFPLLVDFSRSIVAVEQKIFKETRVETVEEILQLKRSIVNIRSAMQPHKYVIRKLIDASPKFLSSPKLAIYYANLIDHTKEIWDALENNKEAITALYDTNMALYSLRLNRVMRSYTTISVIIFAMTLTATLFAVHAAGTPFLDLPLAFWVILLIELGVGLTMHLFFKLKKWT